MNRVLFVVASSVLLAVAAGCGSTQKIFTINSFPSGATIYVDGSPRGQTDMEKLSINFKNKSQVIVRLEREGCQPSGAVLKLESDSVQFFPLQESPNNQKIIDSLNSLLRNQERFLNQVTELINQMKSGKES